jgi:hypothetical protein
VISVKFSKNKLDMNSEEEARLKASFGLAANSLATFFKTSREMQKEAYYFGQRDAFDDIVNFIVKESKGDIKHLNTNTLLQFIEDRTVQLREQVSEIEKKRIESTSNKVSEDTSMGSISSLPTPIRNFAYELDENTVMNYKVPDMSAELGLNPGNMKNQKFGNN